MNDRKPIILTNAFRRPRGTRFADGVRVCDKREVYAATEDVIRVITQCLDAMPVLLPTATDFDTAAHLLDVVDGILLPGGVSNIHPECYGDEPNGMPQVFAQDHDALDIFLVRQAAERGIPLLGICRGMQAINVALGGTMHQNLRELQQVDHLCSMPKAGDPFGPRDQHVVSVEAGGILSKWLPERLRVNSIHEQAVKDLGKGLVVEARAEDGVIEAISAPNAKAFLVGLQWHPEMSMDDDKSRAIFTAFKQTVL